MSERPTKRLSPQDRFFGDYEYQDTEQYYSDELKLRQTALEMSRDAYEHHSLERLINERANYHLDKLGQDLIE